MKIQHRDNGGGGITSLTTKYKAITDSAGNWAKGDKLSYSLIFASGGDQTPYWRNESTGSEIALGDFPVIGTDAVLWEKRMPLSSILLSVTGSTPVPITPANIPAEANLAEITISGGGANGVYMLDTGEDPVVGTNFGHKGFDSSFIELESKLSISQFKVLLSDSGEPANLTISFYCIGDEGNE